MPGKERTNYPKRFSSRNREMFNNLVRDTVRFLKKTDRFDDLIAKNIPLEDGRGYLAPFCEFHSRDEQMIRSLSDWREKNMFAFPTQFKVTIEGTKKWVREQLLDIDGRILFLVTRADGKIIGHLGYNHCINENAEFEIDNVIRGIKDESPGIMSEGMRALLTWAQNQFNPRLFYLKVFDDNQHAIRFYKQLGFAESERIPLQKKIEGETISYCPITEEANKKKCDKIFLKMVYSP